MADSEVVQVRPRSWQRHLVLVLAVLAVVHSIILTLWLAPSGAVRDVVSPSSLASYVNPYFQQRWAGLDPNAQHVDETLQVRARVKDSTTGRARVTAWVDVTALDDRSLRHTVEQRRAALIARRLATNLNGAMFALTPEQRQLVRGNYTTDRIGGLQRAMNRSGGSDAAVANYIAYDQMATQFGSLVASARVEDELRGVQYRSGRRTVPPYAERGEGSVRDLEYVWFNFGWRSVFRGSPEARAVFADYLGA